MLSLWFVVDVAIVLMVKNNISNLIANLQNFMVLMLIVELKDDNMAIRKRFFLHE